MLGVLIVAILIIAGVLAGYAFLSQMREAARLRGENKKLLKVYGRVELLLIEIGDESFGMVDPVLSRKANEELAFLRSAV